MQQWEQDQATYGKTPKRLDSDCYLEGGEDGEVPPDTQEALCRRRVAPISFQQARDTFADLLGHKLQSIAANSTEILLDEAQKEELESVLNGIRALELAESAEPSQPRPQTSVNMIIENFSIQHSRVFFAARVDPGTRKVVEEHHGPLSSKERYETLFCNMWVGLAEVSFSASPGSEEDINEHAIVPASKSEDPSNAS